MSLFRAFAANWADLDRKSRSSLSRIFIALAVNLALLLLLAGRWDYLGGWLYIAWLFIYSFVYGLWLIAENPELFIQRLNLFPPGTKSFEKPFWIVWRGLTFVMLIVSALDVRFGWTTVPLWLVYSSFVVSLILSCLGIWPIIVNRHFESNVRIQTDRDHKVIDRGPYRVVRHPGYALAVPSMLLLPLMLQSWWAMIPAVGVLIAFVVRTALEDRMLRSELEGYDEYAKRVRWRLLPGIW